MSRSPASSPLVLVGLDAGDPGFLETWASRGELPVLSDLMDRGAWARTGGPELVSEHGTWLSYFSGVSRGDHGHYYYRQLRPGTYELATATPEETGVLPFWSRVPDRPIVVMDAPDVPVLRDRAGVQLLHWGSHDSWDPDHYAPASEPAGLVEEIRRRFGPYPGVSERYDASPEEDRRALHGLLEAVRAREDVLDHLLGIDPPHDLVVAVFAETHVASHRFWRYGPGVPAEERVEDERLAGAILEVYREVDRSIGRLLETVGGDPSVVVIGSVGLEDDFAATGLTEGFLRELGYQVAPSDDGGVPGPVSLLRRLVPERWREAVGSRILSRDRRERLLAERFRRSSDWSRTNVFAIPSTYTGLLRVNLAGREPEGIVDPSDYPDLLDRVEADLRRLTDAETGEPVVRETHRSTDLFGGGPPDSLPDLFVEWKKGKFFERVRHPGGIIVQHRPAFFRRSDHGTHGFVVAAGPSVTVRGKRSDVDVLDVAPLCEALAGVSPPTGVGSRWLSTAGPGSPPGA